MASSSAVVMPGWRLALIASMVSPTTRPALRRPVRSLSDSTVMRSSFCGGPFQVVYADMEEWFMAYSPECVEGVLRSEGLGRAEQEIPQGPNQRPTHHADYGTHDGQGQQDEDHEVYRLQGIP